MVVSNTTVLLYLLKIRRADLLKNSFQRIHIPQEVYNELLVGEEKYHQEILLLNDLIKEKFILIHQVKNAKDFGLDKGENEALSLCSELREKVFLSDDRSARKTAETLQCTVMGSLGVLLLSVKKGILSRRQALDVLQQLIEKGYYLSAELYIEIVKRLGEKK